MPKFPSSKSKPGKAARGKQSSPLAEEQRALLAEQQRVAEEIAALERSLHEAPKPPAEKRRQNNAAYLAGSHGPRAFHRHQATIAGARYMESPSMASRPKKRSGRVMLRREKAEGRVQTVALVIALAGALLWLASRYLS